MVFGRHLQTVLDAWAGRALAGGDRLYPAAPQLLDRIWQATFSVAGGERAGRAGDGLMLSRTQPRPHDNPSATLAELQNPIIDAYLHALPAGRAPRILGSRSLFVADSRAEALRPEYEQRLRAHQQGLADIARTIGWSFTRARTDRPPHLTLVALYRLLAESYD